MIRRNSLRESVHNFWRQDKRVYRGCGVVRWLQLVQLVWLFCHRFRCGIIKSRGCHFRWLCLANEFFTDLQLTMPHRGSPDLPHSGIYWRKGGWVIFTLLWKCSNKSYDWRFCLGLYWNAVNFWRHRFSVRLRNFVIAMIHGLATVLATLLLKCSKLVWICVDLKLIYRVLQRIVVMVAF